MNFQLFSKRTLAVVLLCIFDSSLLHAAYNDPSVAVKVVLSGSNANQPIISLPPSGPASATLMAAATNFTPTTYNWSQVLPASQALFAANAPVTFVSTITSQPQVGVSFPQRGIYQLQVVASNGTQSVTQYIWVQVWDRTSGFNPLKQIGRNPGVNPPTSVRQLSPDPGPYCHPRLLFTRADWAEFNAKTTASSDVQAAIASLQSSLSNNFDSANGSLRLYANALTTWADGGFDATYFTNSVQPVYTFAGTGSLSIQPQDRFPDALLAAAYLAWVGSDPTLPQSSVPITKQNRFRYLAKISSAAARAELQQTTPAAAHIMAVVYDLLYDWMTDPQRADFRDYLYTVGYGYFNTGGGGVQRGTQPTSYSANGDFPNLSDPIILSALVIEGEESSVTPAVVAANTPIQPVVTGPTAWPYASPASVWNLYRMARWYSEYFITPWGSPLNHHAYLELSMGGSGGAMLALARRGQNPFVTTNLYQASLHAFNNLNPRPSDGKPVLWDHHDSMGFGNGPNTNDGRYLALYMYPDDPMIQYVYRAFRAENSNAFCTAVFHSDSATNTLAQVAQAKNLPLSQFDPFRGAAVTRNSWQENDLSLYFECRPDVEGHMHAEANSFSLYALGRPWASPSGYHITINDCASTVLIQDPSLASDPVSQGYIGESGSDGTTTQTRSQFPTPPGKFLEATEDPGKQWSLFAGDATAAYQYAFEGSGQNTGIRTSSFFYGEVLNQSQPSYDATADTSMLQLGNLAYNPVQYALRSVFAVRGAKPYVLVMDDITADGVSPRNYRWNMSAAISFGGSEGRYVDANNNQVFSSLRMQTGATANQAILYHVKDVASGPRLLVRDLSEQSTNGQPAIQIDTRPVSATPENYNLTYGYDNNTHSFSYIPTNRLLITRQNVVSPKYKVLLFPHLSGDNLPLTSWNANNTVASIDLRNGYTDQITLDSTQTDKRTRVRAFVRTSNGRTAPTLILPADLTLSASTSTPAFNGQPGAPGTFTITATDDTSTSLIPSVSSPSGTVFPIGVNTVFVTATDSRNQITSRQFTVTVLPAAPVVKVTSVSNLSSDPKGITLSWTPYTGATAYSVKRATTPGGPYTVMSDRQTSNFFIDSGLTGTGYFYVVTAWVNSQEGPASSEISIAGNAAPFTGQYIGTASSGQGFYNQGSSYLLTFTGGQVGNFNDQMAFLSVPWTGDGSFTTRLVSVRGQGGDVSAFGSYGIALRDGSAPGAIMASSIYNTYVNPLLLTYRASAGSLATSAGPYSFLNIATPIWLRLTRSGNSITAFYSNDGAIWTQTASSVSLNLPASTLVGLAGGGQNTTLTSTLFDNVVFLGTPVATIQPGLASLSWQASPGLTFTVERAANPNGPFSVLASGQTNATFTDPNVSVGNTYYYRVSTTGPLGGATVSPVVSAYYPNPVTAPTGLSLTPSLGQIALTWNAGATDTNPTYSVLRATSVNGPFVVVASGLTTASYTDSGFINGTTYFYRIVADNGVSTATSTVSSSTSINGTFTKANNTALLDVAGSWSPTSIPSLGDVALWNGTYTNGTVSAGIGAGISVAQLQMTSPSTAITIDVGTGSLALGAGGLDLSASTQNLTVNAPVTLAASQNWTINTSRTATLNAGISESGGARTLTKAGSGTLVLASANTFTGGLNITAGTVTFGGTGVVNATGLTAAAATGTVTYANTSATPNSLHFASGASLAKFTPGGTAVTLTNSGPVAFAVYGYNTASTWTTTFSGGTWTLGSAGANGTGSQLNGTTVITNGAVVNVTTGRYGGHGTWQVGGIGGPGTLAFPGMTSENGASYPFSLTVNSGGSYTGTATILSFNQAITTAQSNAITVNTGGAVSLSGNLQLGGTNAMGTGGSETDTLNLNGGKLSINGTLFASTALANATKTFNWTGGQLTAATITAGAGFTTPAAGGLSATDLTQSAGTLAPGDIGIAGKTAINGNYNLGSGGTLALDIGGTTQATGFQTGQYDYLTVSGTTTLAGNLSIKLINGFTPSNATIFTILNSTGTLSGAFANVASGQVLVTSGAEGTFVVTVASNKVTLGSYTALTALQSWRYTNLGAIGNSGNAADIANPDGDALNNLLEYAFGGNPTTADNVAPTGSVNTSGFLQITFPRLRSDLTYNVEGSNDLTNWPNLAINPGLLGQTVIYTTTQSYHFLRLRITNP